MSCNRKYYGIYGTNGFGIFSDYETALNTRRYLSKFKIQRFDCFEDAACYAATGYNEFVYPEDNEAYYNYNFKLCLNWVYYKKEIRNRNHREVG